jgi:hypothetical protein
MSLTIWQQSSRRCTVTVTGAAIAVQLFDGDDVVDERAVSSSEHALSVAEAWRARSPSQRRITSGRRRLTMPRPASHKPEGTTVVPRVVWLDRR